MIYLDTSAFLKLVKVEPESSALSEYLRGSPMSNCVSSKLLTIEARRAVLRAAPERMHRTDLMLELVAQVDISEVVIESASRIAEPLSRSLDAIHVATAEMISASIDVLLSYDDRVLEVAAAHGIRTAAPR